MRDVPDSQEVWADAASDASVVVEFVDLVPAAQARPPPRTLALLSSFVF